ncbi:hypothetical protein [Actinomadura napierensis]|uniref:MFS transporter n=1 Tax=Actinomadura napierensis TaxID=267854 RepID=A0ABP5KC77_9ACTN
MLLAGPAAPRVARRAGSRVPLQAGTVCAVAAFALLAWAHGALGEVYLACAVIGIGYGLAFASIGNLVVENAAVESGYTAAFAVLTVTGVIALVSAAAIPRRPGMARDSQKIGGCGFRQRSGTCA